MKQRGIPGLQVAVIQRGAIVWRGAFGLASVEHGVPVTDRTVFQINSITKAFTGVAIMQLVEAGALELDAPISRYVDDLPQSWRAVTVRQLLAHISGLPDIVDDDFNLVAAGEDAAWAKVQTMPLEFPPGEQFKYNQTNYLLLGKLIDKLGAEPFTRFIAKRQFEVVGMRSTGFHDARDVVPHFVRTYRHVGEVLNTRHELWPSRLLTAAGITTTAEELARWTIALQRGQLLSKASVAAMWTPARLTDGSTRGFGPRLDGYAVGWPTAERPKHRAVMPTGGARAVLAIYPDDDLAIVILTNLLGASPESFVDEVAAFYFDR
jgi:CubicO group peptidase (beta-lactamase class C family)